MLSELVLEVEAGSPPGGTPSEGSASSLAAACGMSTRCTPCTPQMASFSPPTSTHMAQRSMPEGIPELPELCQAANAMKRNCVAEHGLLRTSPMQQLADASQRRPAGATQIGAALGVGGAAAGGDASRRSPVCARQLGAASTSLGVAVLSGDASQRSPLGCIGAIPLPMPKPMQCSPTGRWMAENIIPLKPCDAPLPTPSGHQQVLTGTCPPVLSPDSSVQDASQRIPVGSALPVLTPIVLAVLTPVDDCSDSLKSWLSGTSVDGSSESGIDLVERLRAAAPEIYED